MENWDNIEAVTRMQDYINENIQNPISLYNLSQAAGYSPYHAARMFKELIGKTPFEYIRVLRLSMAAVKLRDEKTKVLDIALDFVFDSHEGFTRAFSKQFGISPHRYSKNTPPIKLFLPNRVREYYLNFKKGERKMSEKATTNTIFIQVIDRPARKLILKRGTNAKHYFEYCDEVGCDVWGILTSIKEALYEPIGMWMPENLRTPGTSIYTQGVEVPLDYQGEVPEGFEVMDLKPCKMIIFQGQPYDDDYFSDAIEAFSLAIKDYNPEIFGFEYADEEGPKFQLMPQGYRGYIEGRPVRQLSK